MGYERSLDETKEALAEECWLTARDCQRLVAGRNEGVELGVDNGVIWGQFGVVLHGDIAERAALVACHRQSDQALGLMGFLRARYR